MELTNLKTHKCFGGKVQFWEHDSSSTKTKMKFSTFIPDGKVKGCVIWLSGLTCTDENFITKAGAQKFLSENGMMIICPDTSPRGLDLPNEHAAYDFGSGAGFYVNATTDGYKDHYKMYDYVAHELYGIIQKEFKVEKISISGHSMGGHGALIIGLKEKGRFKSISAFSPIVNPTKCPWGIKAFEGYFGEKGIMWEAHDATVLVASEVKHEGAILIHQGLEDDFYKNGQLLTENFQKACNDSGQACEIKMVEGYDHSYYFIATFIDEHLRHHLSALSK